MENSDRDPQHEGGRRRSDRDYSFLLGEILGKVDATEKHIAQQNGTLVKVDKTTTELALKVSALPCDLQAEQLSLKTAQATCSWVEIYT